jgi:D-alanyl-D-alanine carboxypeptidase (penicillin-binding protein 5/6)
MNDTAKDLGMTNTTYTDASGLKETTVSTAEDQVKLGNQLVQDPGADGHHQAAELGRPVRQEVDQLQPPRAVQQRHRHQDRHHHRGRRQPAVRRHQGGRRRDGIVVGAILGQHTAPIIDTVNAVSKTAMLAAQDAMTSAKILKKGTSSGTSTTGSAVTRRSSSPRTSRRSAGPGLKVKLSFAPDAVPHEAKAGTKVGTLTVGDGTSGAVKVPVALQKDLANRP